MKLYLDNLSLAQMRDRLAANNIGRFHLEITASGDTNGGGTLLEYKLSQYDYGSEAVKGNELFTVTDEFIRRFGWQQAHDPVLIPNHSQEEPF